MNRCRKPVFFILAAFLVLSGAQAVGQVVVNGKNLNDDKELEYFQFMYYIDRSTFKPVYFVDYGTIDIDNSSGRKSQKIIIKGEELKDNVSAVWAMNKFYKSGWEYVGDVEYINIPMMDNWFILTMRRRKG